VQQKFEDLRANLDEFIQQTDYSLMLVSCRPEDCPFISRFLDGQDAARPESFFIVWPGDFVDPTRYVSRLVTFLENRMEEARSARAERGAPPFPPLPANLKDEQRDPVERFRQWLAFLVTLLDDLRSQSFVVGLLPGVCSDPAGYARLIASVLPIPARPAWLEPLRIVAFDSKDAPQLFPVLESQGADTVLTWEVDFSTPALTDSLAREASNASLPLQQRMACLLQLAGIDFAHQRHADAQEKFAVLYDYYGKPPQPTMQAVCLHAAGESLVATGELEKGKTFYERGVALCMQDNAFGPMLILLQALIRVCSLLGSHAEAESYAQSGGALAGAMLNSALYAHFEELAGDAQLAQGNREGAVATYEHAVVLARAYDQFIVWRSVLDKLAALHARAGRSDLARDMGHERERVEALALAGVSEGRKPAAEAAP
jgi:tetratricopeptide (TPR) repeat protein